MVDILPDLGDSTQTTPPVHASTSKPVNRDDGEDSMSEDEGENDQSNRDDVGLNLFKDDAILRVVVERMEEDTHAEDVLEDDDDEGLNALYMPSWWGVVLLLFKSIISGIGSP